MSHFVRVNKSNLCPICGAANWCTLSADGAIAKCMRESEGSFKSEEDGSGLAHFHRLTETPVKPGARFERKVKQSELPPHVPAMEKLATRAQLIGVKRINQLAESLGVKPRSLAALGVGWVTASELQDHDTPCSGAGCYTFPMRNHLEEVCGVRLRKPDGYKYSVKGGHNGFFSPITLPDRRARLYVVEGPTDTAALLSMGLMAVGRPSNTGGSKLIRELCKAHGVVMVTAIVDRDAPGSRAAKNTMRGVRALAAELESVRCLTRMIRPPRDIKDVRAWLNAGATAADIDRADRQGTLINTKGQTGKAAS